jgi:hypothetical protein
MVEIYIAKGDMIEAVGHEALVSSSKEHLAKLQGEHYTDPEFAYVSRSPWTIIQQQTK